MGFTVNGLDVMSKYDTTYASENVTAISGFKINGTDIGKSATPGISGYTTDDPTTNDAFKTANVSFNELFSTSKPLVVVTDIHTTNQTVGDYIFRESTAIAWRDMIRFTIPNIPGIQIPLRILLVGGGGGGGSSGEHGIPNCESGAGGGGAGTFLELTMILNETHDQYYLRALCGQKGLGGSPYGGDNSAKGDSGAEGSNTYFELRNPSRAAVNEYQAEGGGGGGGNKDTYHANPANHSPGGSGGGACGYGGTRNGGTGGTGGAYSETISIPDEHPTTTVDAARFNNGGKANEGQGGAGGGGAGGAGNTGGAIGGVWVFSNGHKDSSEGYGGANGGNGYYWINGGKYAAGGAGDHRCESSHQYGNEGYNRYGHPGGGDRTAGAGIKDAITAIPGTGSGGCGHFNGWNGQQGGHGGDGFVSIGIPRIFTDANHHTFTPAYL